MPKATQVAATRVTAAPQWRMPALARAHSAAAKCAWFADAVAALIYVFADAAAQGQTGPS